MTREDKSKQVEELFQVAREHGFRQLDIAELLDTTESRVSEWANGHHLPNRQYRKLIPSTIERMKAEPRPARSVNT